MDNDSSMLSTPSSHDGADDTLDEEQLFTGMNQSSNPTLNTPGYVNPQIPQNDHLNAAVSGELSPPRSQSLSTGEGGNGANGFNAVAQEQVAADEDESTEDEGIDVKGSRSQQQQQDEDKNKPGAGWKNKKSQEEMQRTWEYVIDKDFDMRSFGDPLSGS